MSELSELIQYVEGKSEHLSNKDLAILQSQIKRLMHKTSYDKEQHLTTSIFFTAYTYMLDTNKSAKECIIYAATVHMKDVEKILAEKSNHSGKLNRKVVKSHDRHPIQVDMIREKTFNRQALANTKNLWQLLNTLSTFRQTYQWLKELKLSVRDLSVRVSLNEAEIERLNNLLGLGKMSDREKVKYLRQTGATYQHISEVTGKSISTVKRWLNNE